MALDKELPNQILFNQSEQARRPGTARACAHWSRCAGGMHALPLPWPALARAVAGPTLAPAGCLPCAAPPPMHLDLQGSAVGGNGKLWHIVDSGLRGLGAKTPRLCP